MSSGVAAVLLAGGRGTRLGVIAEKVCKPAVPFGGTYRLIDFPLSNCVNSGIKKVGVLLRHPSRTPVLKKMLKDPETRERFDRELELLPEEYVGQYQGTADAVYRNMEFIDSHNPRQALILCADHVYRQDYRKMLDFHRQNQADLTISVTEVPYDSASRFGIMHTDPEQRITEFEEKPNNPTSNLASMGIYIFDHHMLRRYLTRDQKDPSSDRDFGKNIIPRMIDEQCRVFAYRFEGYWMDVGTKEDYWQANMDLLRKEKEGNFEDGDWPIYKNHDLPPAELIHEPRQGVLCSRINKQSRINGSRVAWSVICNQVEIGKDARIVNSVVLPEARIEDQAVIENVVVCEDRKIPVQR